MSDRCQFIKKNGDRRGANPQAGKDVCIFHDPTKAAAGREARRAGGINRSRPAAVLASDAADKPLGSAVEISALLRCVAPEQLRCVAPELKQ